MNTRKRAQQTEVPTPLNKEEREAIDTLNVHNARDLTLIKLFHRLAFPEQYQGQ